MRKRSLLIIMLITFVSVASLFGLLSSEEVFASNIRWNHITSVTLSGTSFAWTGAEIKPTIKVVKTSSGTVVSSKNYNVTYSNNVKVGTGTVRVTGKGNYRGDVTVNFKITKRNVNQCIVNISPISYYFGHERIPDVKVYSTYGVAIKQGNYTLKFSNCKKPGTGTVKITGKGNLTGSITKTFPISKFSITPGTNDVRIPTFYMYYTGKALKPKILYSQYDRIGLKYVDLKEGTDYTVSYSNNVKVGTMKVTIAGKGNYGGSETFSIKIVKVGTKVPKDKLIANNTLHIKIW